MADTPFWLTAAAGLGVGTLLGTVITGVLNSRSAAKQRELEKELRTSDHQQERAMRGIDHLNQLAVERLKDEHQLRDQRLTSLRRGLASIVLAAVNTERFIQILPNDDPLSQAERMELRERIRTLSEQARAELLLDKEGAPLVRKFDDVDAGIRHYQHMQASLATQIQQAEGAGGDTRDQVVAYAERAEEEWKSLLVKIRELSGVARETIDRVALAGVETEANQAAVTREH